MVDTAEVEASLAFVKVVIDPTELGSCQHLLVGLFGCLLRVEIDSDIPNVPFPFPALKLEGPSCIARLEVNLPCTHQLRNYSQKSLSSSIAARRSKCVRTTVFGKMKLDRRPLGMPGSLDTGTYARKWPGESVTLFNSTCRVRCWSRAT